MPYILWMIFSISCAHICPSISGFVADHNRLAEVLDLYAVNSLSSMHRF